MTQFSKLVLALCCLLPAAHTTAQTQQQRASVHTKLPKDSSKEVSKHDKPTSAKQPSHLPAPAAAERQLTEEVVLERPRAVAILNRSLVFVPILLAIVYLLPSTIT